MLTRKILTNVNIGNLLTNEYACIRNILTNEHIRNVLNNEYIRNILTI